MDGPALRIDDLVGGRVVLAVGDQLSVGRQADFCVGADDRQLHRRLFCLWYDGAAWRLENTGSHISVVLIHSVAGTIIKTSTRTVVPPKASTALDRGTTLIVFHTQDCVYEMQVDVSVEKIVHPRFVDDLTLGEPTTPGYEPSEVEVELLDALIEPLLMNPGAHVSAVGEARHLAEKLGWDAKYTNRRIDRLVDKLAKCGQRTFKPHMHFLAQYWMHRNNQA